MRNPMFVHDPSMTELVMDYCRWRLALDPVPLDYGGAQDSFDDVLSGLLGRDAHDPAAVLAVFTGELASAVISCDSPRFLSFIPAAPTKAALLFDMVVSCSSLQGTSWLEAAGAVAAENQALHLLAGLAGLPAGAGGCFVPGGTAREPLCPPRRPRHRRPPPDGPAPARPQVAVSDEAHSSIAKALQIIGVEALVVPAEDHRLTGTALRRALAGHAHDRRRHRGGGHGRHHERRHRRRPGRGGRRGGRASPVVPRRRRLRRGGAVRPLGPARFDGIDRADSFIVDPHKWLFAPFDCAALLYRTPALAKAVHSQDASYLDVLHPPGDDPGETRNPSDYSIGLTRRARGLPLWFSLAVHGTDAYRDAVETVLSTTQGCADLIEELDYLELVRRARAVGDPFSADRLGPVRLRPVVGRSPRRPDRFRHPDHLGGAADWASRPPAPRHERRHGGGDPRHHGLMTAGRRSVALVVQGTAGARGGRVVQLGGVAEG